MRRIKKKATYYKSQGKEIGDNKSKINQLSMPIDKNIQTKDSIKCSMNIAKLEAAFKF